MAWKLPMTCIIPSTDGAPSGPLAIQDAGYVVQPAAFSFLKYSPSLALEEQPRGGLDTPLHR